MKITKEDLLKLCNHFGDKDSPSNECDCYHCDVIASCSAASGIPLTFS